MKAAPSSAASFFDGVGFVAEPGAGIVHAMRPLRRGDQRSCVFRLDQRTRSTTFSMAT